MMDYLILVNKKNKLSCDYCPSNLVEIDSVVKGNVDPERKILINKVVLDHWLLLKSEAAKYNFKFHISSCYRSYSYQDQVLKYYIDKEGIDIAMSHVAPPGASEHQTGLAIDYFFVKDDKNYYDMKEDDPEYIWIKNNAHYFGFIIRYPKDKEDITMYTYEPWHLRYVGDKATYLYENQLTLEEYYQKIKVKQIQG